MHTKLLAHFSAIIPLSEDEIAAIDETMTTKTYKKGTILLREGQVSAEAYFVLEGIVRQYYLIDGTEKTTDFFADEEWVTSFNSMNPSQPAPFYLECCTACTLLVGDSDKGEDLYNKYPKLGIISRKVMEKVFTEMQVKLENFTTSSPTLRYANLLKSRPDLFQRIPQYQIASYIGVTPESLSRIRKRIAKGSDA